MQNLELVQLKKLKVNISDEVGISRLKNMEETYMMTIREAKKEYTESKARV